jgi:hypothetical protein
LESFRIKDAREQWVTSTVLILGGVAFPSRPWHEWAFYGAAVFTVVALLEIRGKLEAIRFMMAHEFGKKNGLLDP